VFKLQSCDDIVMSLDFFSKTVSFLFYLPTFLKVVVLVALGITAIKLTRVVLLIELSQSYGVLPATRQVNTPHSQSGRYSIYLPRRNGRL